LVDIAGNIISSSPYSPTPNPTGIPPIPTIRSNYGYWVICFFKSRKYHLNFRIRSGSTADNGNDAAIDDIRVYQLPETCILKKIFQLMYPLKSI
jgi:hypothetical protein